MFVLAKTCERPRVFAVVERDHEWGTGCVWTHMCMGVPAEHNAALLRTCVIRRSWLGGDLWACTGAANRAPETDLV